MGSRIGREGRVVGEGGGGKEGRAGEGSGTEQNRCLGMCLWWERGEAQREGRRGEVGGVQGHTIHLVVTLGD